MKSRAQIKEESKGFIRTGQVSVLVVSAIVIVVGLVLSEVSSLLDTGDFSYKLETLLAAVAERETAEGPEIEGTFDLTQKHFTALYSKNRIS